MIYNGFDPGMLVLLSGEDRVVLEDSEITAETGRVPLLLMLSVCGAVLLTAAILLSGIAA